MNVFISYNHRDQEYADTIRQLLEENAIRVTMDSCNMIAGERIIDFIADAIRKTDATVSIVSRNSLLSTWVTIESIRSLKKKFIPCYTDSEFMNRDFIMLAGQTIAEQLSDIQKMKNDAVSAGLGTEHLDDELARYHDLQENLSTILYKLKNCLCLDISNLLIHRDISGLVRSLLKQELKEEELKAWWDALGSDWKEVLRMNGNLGEHPEPEQLRSLIELKSVDCHKKPVNNLSPLAVFNDLEILFCENTLVRSLDPLSRLLHLQFLDCSNTFVGSLDPLTGLKKLRKVICWNTKIQSSNVDLFLAKLPACKVISANPILPSC